MKPNTTSKARLVIAAAMARQEARDIATPRVEWDAVNKMVRRQRTTLTRAINSKDPDRVVLACRDAVREWSKPGLMWPDDWSRWQRALNDAVPGRHLDIRDLAG